MSKLITINATESILNPPEWALLERELIDKINDAAPKVLEKYTRPDGTLFWPTSPDFQALTGLTTATRAFITGHCFIYWAVTTGFLRSRTGNLTLSMITWQSSALDMAIQWSSKIISQVTIGFIKVRAIIYFTCYVWLIRLMKITLSVLQDLPDSL